MRKSFSSIQINQNKIIKKIHTYPTVGKLFVMHWTNRKRGIMNDIKPLTPKKKD